MIILLSLLVGFIGFQIVSVSSNKIADIYHANRDDDDIMNLTSSSKRGEISFLTLFSFAVHREVVRLFSSIHLVT